MAKKGVPSAAAAAARVRIAEKTVTPFPGGRYATRTRAACVLSLFRIVISAASMLESAGAFHDSYAVIPSAA